MENNKNSNPKPKRKNRVKNWTQKSTIVALSVALGLAGTAAIVAPVLVSVLKKGGGGDTPQPGPTPATIITITFNPGEHGTLVGEPIAYLKAGSKFAMANATQPSPNRGYVFNGWKMPNGSFITDDTIVSSDITLTASYIETEVKIGITLDCSEWKEYGGYVEQPYYNFKQGCKWGSIKNSIPNPYEPTYLGELYEFKYWYVDDGTVPEAIKDSYTFNQDTTLKPHFEARTYEIQKLPIRFNLIHDGTSQIDQYQDPHDSTSLEQTANYCDEEAYTEVYTFSQLKKPVILEAGKSFSKWYKKWSWDSGYSDEWKPTDKLTPSAIGPDGYIEIYAECIVTHNDPVITFSNGDEDPNKITWIGNREVKHLGESVAWEDVIKPYVFKDIQGTPEKGFTSPWYFKGWYYKDENDVEQPVPTTITNSIIVYPKFQEKPKITFELDDSASPKTQEVAINVNDTWGDVVPPGVATSSKATNIFIGWSGKSISESGEVALTPDFKLEDLDTDTHIKPIFSDSCNKLEFVDEGIVDDGEEEWTETVHAAYTGNEIVGTDKTSNVNFKSKVNKPVPRAQKEDPQNPGQYIDIYNYSFSGEWQYSEDNKATWHTVTPEYEIKRLTSEEQDPTLTYIRPIFYPTAKVSYDENGGKILPWKEGEEVVKDIYVTADIPFANMYKPTVTPPTDKQFLYWATRMEDPENPGQYLYNKVTPETVFKKDTTLYAVFDETEISLTINYKLTDVDAAAGATMSGNKATINVKASSSGVEFKEFAKGMPEKKGYILDYWSYDQAGTKKVADDTKFTIATASGLGVNVYAQFKKDDRYNKVSVKKPGAGDTYTIEGESEVFVPANGSLPVNAADGSLTSNGKSVVKIKNIGYEVVGWKAQIDGKEKVIYHKKTATHEEVEPIKVTEPLTDIIPIFDVATRIISWDKGEAESIDGGYPTTPDRDVPFQINVLDYVNAKGYKAHKEMCNHVGWEYCVASSTSEPTWLDVTSDLTLTSDITIRPKFITKSAFEEGDHPYFYDDERKQFGQITSFNDPNYLNVYYPGGETTTLEKATFNKQVWIPLAKMTAIPDNFMAGCTKWNNGGKPFEIGTEDEPAVVETIGKDFLSDCVSFNQKVTIVTKKQTLSIAENFMAKCYSFASDIKIAQTYIAEGEAFLNFENGFMFECRDFVNTLDISTFSTINVGKQEPYLYYNCLSSFEIRSKIFTQGYNIKTHGKAEGPIIGMLPDLKGDGTKPYRHVNKIN